MSRDFFKSQWNTRWKQVSQDFSLQGVPDFFNVLSKFTLHFICTCNFSTGEGTHYSRVKSLNAKWNQLWKCIMRNASTDLIFFSLFSECHLSLQLFSLFQLSSSLFLEEELFFPAMFKHRSRLATSCSFSLQVRICTFEQEWAAVSNQISPQLKTTAQRRKKATPEKLKKKQHIDLGCFTA